MAPTSLSISDSVPAMQWALVPKRSSGSSIKPEYIQIPVPAIAADDVLVQIKFSGVCYQHSETWKDEAWTKTHPIGGHEGTGLVVAVGENVDNLAVADRVGVQWANQSCGNCDFCHSGCEPLCPDARFSGYTVDGTFQQYAVCKATHVVRIPDDVALDEAASILCSSGTVYKALKESNAQPGQIVAIAGQGGLTSFACQLAKACGFRVLALANEANVTAMKLLGVAFFVDCLSPDVVSEVKSVTGGGPHATLVVTAEETLFHQAIQFVRPRGTVVAVGVPAGGIQTDLFVPMMRMVNIKGSCVANSSETAEALGVVTQAKLNIPHRVLELQDLPGIHELIDKGELQERVVLSLPEPHQDDPSDGAFALSPRVPEFSQSQYNIGTYLAYRLEELGIRDYFVVPGDFNLILLDQILKSEYLRMVGCCNELNAGYAADGYARSSPTRVAVVMVTFMVGSLSVVNAIAGAYSDRLRVVVVCSCPKSITFGQNRVIHHTLGVPDRDQSLRMYREVTTASVRLSRDQKSARQTLDQTLVQCVENSLPVYIEIPADISEMPCDSPQPLAFQRPDLAPANQLQEAIHAVTDAWNSAHRPVVLIGALARSVLPETLVAVLDKLGCAVFCQPDAKSLVPENYPQFAGTFWSKALEPALCGETVMNSDLWVVIGGRWSDYHTLGDTLDISKESYRVLDLQDEYIQAPESHIIQGIPLAQALTALVKSDIKKKPIAMELTKQESHPMSMNNTTLTVASILSGIEHLLRPQDTLIAETGDSWFNAQRIRLPHGTDFQMQMIYGSIGWSLPATMGSQLARPDGRTVLMIGDGSFQMTAQEVSTMIRMRMNAVVFIFNNLGYGIETAIHEGPYNYISNWNYAAFTSSLSGVFHTQDLDNPYLSSAEKQKEMDPSVFAMQIKTHGELLVALNRVQREPEKLAILECCIEPKDISDLLVRFGSAVGKKH
ncbi:hypothetical protein ASPWEDRAFT_185948 [Aspergillus wentii DTO 134E9]|uniref:Pyruvate decarboxylase n=1 Tax=Aspergillus wentii DTO 134E9 TaxID=1073089 RepID=A0A1L9RFB1_ASPWE|nr:uncharacterized protein ASPWEDRAFT_185948 [Aspergillus wentii DTO 134E9]KAI9926278.1 Pyruvate decarboxylase 3 [Aspergillus wentii]OJJ33606.1 hypothetical protein ASPWEDRAFT_185948 [Aspergillus wentii DTO 134E9]